ncbi:MAG: Fic family protein [Rhodospirillales bacterium]|nr:Fic family protein [Rhodospirillales bacterium]
MIVHDLTHGETHGSYRKLEASNEQRHYDFLRSIVEAALEMDRPLLSQTVLKALNFHAIACLHSNAGMYRPCIVSVGENENFPEPWQLPDLMDDFVNLVNRHWMESNPLSLAAFVLWRLNRIHPFINGNGRTARAACLFVLCLKLGGWMPYSPILPELIRENRTRYVAILKGIDKSESDGDLDLRPLVDFLSGLLQQQVNAAQAPQ